LDGTQKDIDTYNQEKFNFSSNDNFNYEGNETRTRDEIQKDFRTIDFLIYQEQHQNINWFLH
jgi:hypothetical protein